MHWLIAELQALHLCIKISLAIIRYPFMNLKRRDKLKWLTEDLLNPEIFHIAKVGMRIQNHGEQLPMIITKLGHYPTVLGIPWLRLHDVAVRVASNTVTFGSQHCTTHCHEAPVTVQGVMEESPEPVYQVKDIFEAQIRPPKPFLGNIVMWNGASFFHTVKKENLQYLEHPYMTSIKRSRQRI